MKNWVCVNDLAKSESEDIGIERIFSIMKYSKDTSEAIRNVRKYLKEIGTSIVNEINEVI